MTRYLLVAAVLASSVALTLLRRCEGVVFQPIELSYEETETTIGNIDQATEVVLYPGEAFQSDPESPLLVDFQLESRDSSTSSSRLGYFASASTFGVGSSSESVSVEFPAEVSQPLSGIPCPDCNAVVLAPLRTVSVTNSSTNVTIALSALGVLDSIVSLKVVARNESSFLLSSGQTVQSSAPCGSMKVYAFDWTGSQATITIAVDAIGTARNGVLLVKYGSVPSPTDFDLRSPFRLRSRLAFSGQGAAIGNTKWDTKLRRGRYYIGVARDIADFTYDGYPIVRATGDPVACRQDLQFQLRLFFQADGDSYVFPVIFPTLIFGILGLFVLLGLITCCRRAGPNVGFFGRYTHSLILQKFSPGLAVGKYDPDALRSILSKLPSPAVGVPTSWMAVAAAGIGMNGAIALLNFILAFNAHHLGESNICQYNFLCKRDALILGLHVPALNAIWSGIVYVIVGFTIVLYTAIAHAMDIQPVVTMIHYRSPPYYMFYALGVTCIHAGIAVGAYNICPNRSGPQVDLSFVTLAIVWLVAILFVRAANIGSKSVITGTKASTTVLVAMSGLFLAALRPFTDNDGYSWGVLLGAPVCLLLVYLGFTCKSRTERMVSKSKGKTRLSPCECLRSYGIVAGLAALIQVAVVLAAVLAPLHPSVALFLDAFLLFILSLLAYLFNKLVPKYLRPIATLGKEKEKNKRTELPLDPYQRVAERSEPKPVHPSPTSREEEGKPRVLSGVAVREHLQTPAIMSFLLGTGCVIGAIVFSTDYVRDLSTDTADGSYLENDTCLLLSFYDSYALLHAFIAGSILFFALFGFHCDDDAVLPPPVDLDMPVPMNDPQSRERAMQLIALNSGPPSASEYNSGVDARIDHLGYASAQHLHRSLGGSYGRQRRGSFESQQSKASGMPCSAAAPVATSVAGSIRSNRDPVPDAKDAPVDPLETVPEETPRHPERSPGHRNHHTD